ncbi:sulfide:quinone oxidoreductase [Tropilaelaps mercedesae]|uniref:Sulfide:quinone oxidoreductase, mitochondrial n=1 Tax=Tropilaelaps mercedesae TaxID=418985 RepID=A0A1V9XQX6_9ACAR|nr:sulfide:quinone oxidoreductase [Tropilaelaps mercedesae]
MLAKCAQSTWRPAAVQFAVTSDCIKHCQLLVVGAGSGGLGTAAILGNRFNTVVIDPADFHYYQPYFTFVGAGLKQLEQCRQPLERDVGERKMWYIQQLVLPLQLMPSSVKWIKEAATSFSPSQNCVVTDSGKRITYDILVVATGIHPDFSKVFGLVDALKTPHVGSNYTPETVLKTVEALRNFKHGNAIFTFPSTPIKCPGAPQKIAYLTDEYLRNHGKRESANIIYNTAGEAIFGVKKYAEALWRVAKLKDINVNLQHNLVQVLPDKRQAIFEKVENDNRKTLVSMDYDMLHVTPPMYSIKAVAQSPLADNAGYVDINKETLQHVKFKNVFAIGDCTAHLPKTAAAVAASLGVLADNVVAFNSGKNLSGRYNGYTSCPLTTGFSKCVLAGTLSYTCSEREIAEG